MKQAGITGIFCTGSNVAQSAVTSRRLSSSPIRTIVFGLATPVFGTFGSRTCNDTASVYAPNYINVSIEKYGIHRTSLSSYSLNDVRHKTAKATNIKWAAQASRSVFTPIYPDKVFCAFKRLRNTGFMKKRPVLVCGYTRNAY